MPQELRINEIEDIESRAAEGDKPPVVSGYGIVYDRETEIYPGYREKIRRGAFSKSISGREIKSFINHDKDQVLSTTNSNPALVLVEDEKGLRFESPIPPTSYGNDLIVNLDRKNIRGASFSFTVNDGGDILTRDEKGVYHREIIDGVLYELGPVTNPAYPMAKVGMRSAEDVANDIKSRFVEPEKNEERDDSHESMKNFFTLQKGGNHAR